MAKGKPRRRALPVHHDPDEYLLSDIPGEVITTLSLLQQCVENIDAHLTVAQSSALFTAFTAHKAVLRHAFIRRRSQHDRETIKLSLSPPRREN